MAPTLAEMTMTAIFHAQGDDLIAHTASVFLQIVADNIDDAGLFKDPAIAVDQLRLIDLVILPEEEAAGHHQHDDDDQAEPAGVDHAQCGLRFRRSV